MARCDGCGGTDHDLSVCQTKRVLAQAREIVELKHQLELARGGEGLERCDCGWPIPKDVEMVNVLTTRTASPQFHFLCPLCDQQIMMPASENDTVPGN